jgi:hypothetical protein
MDEIQSLLESRCMVPAARVARRGQHHRAAKPVMPTSGRERHIYKEVPGLHQIRFLTETGTFLPSDIQTPLSLWGMTQAAKCLALLPREMIILVRLDEHR